ncbi:MAG: NADH:ubiquinone oxidoreductase [Anaerolineae bacterium]|nr:NADH:ubiquinone oxidoreductase [Anaerolineae bacterium]MEB2286477.1 NADH:ubiquinone oxidoreductase [Anaerolineae bacterium]
MATKPKIAFFDFTSCEGCQLTVVDLLQTHLGLLDLVEIVQFREAMSEKGEDYQIAFIEGSCTRKSDEARLQKIRAQAAVVVALGACAHLGGVNALKNYWPIEKAQRYVYGEHGQDAYESYPARPISAVIPVDAVIPGCPIDRHEFLRIVQLLLQGRAPHLPDYPLCVECKFKENACLNYHGIPCLGPITRAGCDAICPSYGDGCEGCRGWAPEANFAYMREILRGHGLSDADIDARFTMFNHYQFQQMGEPAPVTTPLGPDRTAPLPTSTFAAPKED